MDRFGGARRIAFGALVVVTLLAGTTMARAYDERYPPVGTGGTHQGAIESECLACHPAGASSCAPCHTGGLSPATAAKGPHGLYQANTRRCGCCHEVHGASGAQLLPGPTVSASCGTCHDATGGEGVYGTIVARGLAVGAQHRIDTTSVVPGGDPVTGGSTTLVFGGPGGKLSCSDCHSPHDAQTVAPFEHERRRAVHDVLSTFVSTNRLLRQRPANVTTAVASYGSDWCLACHQGRLSGGFLHNHPAESKTTTSNPFIYDRVAVLNSDNLTSVTVLGKLAWTNRGYLMPFPRTAQQSGHLPICQQCHEDSRAVGSLSATGDAGDAQAFTVRSSTTTVSAVGDNPRFQNFPHETVNARMTVETADDLCLNCHPPAALP